MPWEANNRMTATPRYSRVLVKLSGEALCASGGSGVGGGPLQYVVEQLQPLSAEGVGMGIVIGAGNLVRGRRLVDIAAIEPTTGDYMGMLATVINALALRDALCEAGVEAVVQSAVPVPLVCENYYRPATMAHLEAGRAVIFAGGTSHPFVTTDMAAAIRSAEIGADILLKATKVDGVFDDDPETNPKAKKYEKLTYSQVLADRLGVMDLPAMAFCMERAIPVRVLDLFRPGNLLAAVRGEDVGTMVSRD
jgi:uridylate kinase